MSVATPAPSSVRPHYAGFEGLRTIGMTAVFFAHLGFITGVTLGRDWAAPLGHLEFSVAIFFIVSAFLLYRPFALAHLRGAPVPDLGLFVWRRMFRIFPAYWATLAVMLVFLGVDSGGAGHLARLFTLTHVYTEWGFTAIDVLVPTWTLAAELIFYFFMIAAAVALRRFAARATTAAERLAAELWLAAGAFGFAMAWRAFVYFADVVPHVAEHWFPGTLDVFATGMALAAVSAFRELSGEAHPVVDRVEQIARRGSWSAVGAFACFMAVPVFLDVDRFIELEPDWQVFVRNLLLLASAALLVVPIVLGGNDRGWYRRFLEVKPIAYLGLTSYGLYLWHDFWLKKATFEWIEIHNLETKFAIIGVIAFALAALCGTASFRLVEQPAQQLGTRLRARLFRQSL